MPRMRTQPMKIAPYTRGRRFLRGAMLNTVGSVFVIGFALAADPPSDKGDKVVTGGDLAFINDAGPGGIAEVELGRLAVEKAASAEVKQFAQQMIEDHTKAGEKLKKLASQKKVTLSPEILPQAKQTKEALAKAAGGVLFIDEAYYLHRPDNERDYGQEAIEILLQEMESERGSLVVIFAGYEDRMESFFSSNPGLSSRVAHHVSFEDYTKPELTAIAELMLERDDYRFSPEAEKAFTEYLDRRLDRPRFANARSVRNALERARLRQANRLVAQGSVSRDDLVMITEEDIRGSRVFADPEQDHREPDGDTAGAGEP